MTSSTQNKLPDHLKKYIVEQNYARYTSEDQATWRFILRQLKYFLTGHAHPAYVEGFQKSGLSVEQIPHIAQIDEHLESMGWGAVPVSGFIPPAAFMEFQSLGILPIASDMRSLAHLEYTPAPDIVHEAAGHAPFLAHAEYASYLKCYGEVARNAIISAKDLAQYDAIRILSEVKESPNSSNAEIFDAEERLEQVNRSITEISEGALLSRMNWWTAEYGLIHDSGGPKIYGAGLLSSVGESRACLSSAVKKIPLSVDCVNYSYNITEPQPHLFVCENFAQLSQVLKEFSHQMAYQLGGVIGLKRAVQAETVNTVTLNSEIQISGILQSYRHTDHPVFLRFSGPSQLSVLNRELPGHGTKSHPQGFSSPIGLLKNQAQCLSTLNDLQLSSLGIRRGQTAQLRFASDILVQGEVVDWIRCEGTLVVISFKNCRVTLGDELLYDPAWGQFDMCVGSTVTSVFGGPADRSAFASTHDFNARLAPGRRLTPEENMRSTYYQQLRELRSNGDADATLKFMNLLEQYLAQTDGPWLQGIELLELSYQFRIPPAVIAPLRAHLQRLVDHPGPMAQCVADGVNLADQKI